MKTAAFALLALLAFAAAENVPFKSCGSPADKATLKSIDVTPPPAAGKTSKITVSGTSTEEVSSGTYKLTATYEGIQVLDQSGNLCTDSTFHINCPVAKGTFTNSGNLAFPSDTPSGSFSIKLTAIDASSNELFCAELTLSVSEESHDLGPNDVEEIMARVNVPGSTWTAGPNGNFDGWETSDFVRSMGSVKDDMRSLPRKTFPENVALPDNFDSRDAWPKCIGPILDQAKCGSCWAFGAAESISDRFCIEKNNTQFLQLAPLDLVMCDRYDNGCEGGMPSSAFNYAQSQGLVTESCAPYLVSEGGPIPTCAPSKEPCLNFVDTPQCNTTCADGSSWSESKHMLSNTYSVDGSNYAQELVKNGPFEVAFTVYADFPSYKSGVYQHTTGQALGGHAVKVIGYGTENGTPYWLIQNSWTTTWGDGGYFKILRGQNECGIEDGGAAGNF